MSHEKKMDKAFDHFYKKKYKEAVKAFDGLLASGDLPDHIKPKIQQFKSMAETHLNDDDQKLEPSLKTVAYLMNLGQFDKAEQLLEKLDAEKGDKEFLLAEASLGKEELDKALDYLTEAIKFNPHNKGYALNSPAFAEYLNHEKFQFLCQKKNEENE